MLKRQRLYVALLLAFLMLQSAAASGAARPFTREYNNEIAGTIIEEFKNPQLSRPMVRYWFPDASAAETEEGLEAVRQELRDMYEAGYSGVEVAMVPRFTLYDSARYGWGTPLFQKLMKEILKEANKFGKTAPYDDGPVFKVDFTSTPQWPVSIDTIDPNDDAASMELSYKVQKLTGLTGSMELELPAKRRLDFAGAPFIFEDRFMAVTIAKVASLGTEPGDLVLDPASMRDITAGVSPTGKTTPAGIPDMNDPYSAQEYAGLMMQIDGDRPAKDGTIYVPVTNENIALVFGAPLPASSPEKVVQTLVNGRWEQQRKRLAETQEYYRIDDLSKLTEAGVDAAYTPSAGAEINAGDWVVFGFYQRGNGHSLGSDVKSQYPVNNGEPGRPYVIDHFSTLGTGATHAFWEQKLFDEELLSLLKQNRGGLFEDSIETLSASPFWSRDLLKVFEESRGYDIAPYLPLLLTAGHGSSPKITVYDPGSYTAPGGSEARFIEDYYAVLTDMYTDSYIGSMQQWSQEKFSGTYRAQAYNTTGMRSMMNLDTPRTALVVGISEGESLNFKTNFDRFRGLTGGVNVSGKQLISDEVLAVSGQGYDLPFSQSIATINRDFSVGVNNMVVHGVSTASAYTGPDGEALWSQWPGWHAFSFNVADSWSARQPYYDDVHTMNDYMARLQAIMQNGQPKLDLLLFAPKAFVGEGTDNEADRSLLLDALDSGYTYDLVSEGALLHENSVVEDGVLIPDGPAYKALVVYDAAGISLAVAQKMAEFAKAGLPVIFIGDAPNRAIGVSGDAVGSTVHETDAQIVDALKELTAVYKIEDPSALVALLQELDVRPNASYAQPYLRNLHRADADGTGYYYLFNLSPENADVQVTLTGDGNPYKLNCWNGDITPVTEYAKVDGGAVVRIQLEPNESVIVALTGDTAAFGDALPVSVTKLSGGEVTFVDGELYLRAPETGDYAISLSNGSNVTVHSAVSNTIPMNDGWRLSLESWGPYDDYAAAGLPTTASEKSTAVFEDFTLTSWKDIQAAPEQVSALKLDGVAKKIAADERMLADYKNNPMGAVVGIGRYAKTFTLDELNADQGYLLQVAKGHDQMTEIIVNGQSIKGLDQSKSIFDIGGYLTQGENTLEIKISTPMNNRLKIEFETPAYWSVYREATNQEPYLFQNRTVRDYGLTSVSLLPYTMTLIENLN